MIDQRRLGWWKEDAEFIHRNRDQFSREEWKYSERTIILIEELDKIRTLSLELANMVLSGSDQAMKKAHEITSATAHQPFEEWERGK